MTADTPDGIGGPDRGRLGSPPLIAGWPSSAILRLLLSAGLVSAATGVGVLSFLAQRHWQARAASGADLGPVTQALADGATPRTAWVGWVAAAFFVVSAIRILRGPLEPPVAIRGGDRGVGGMRRALRREWNWVRRALAVVVLVTLADLGRLGVAVGATAEGFTTARGNLAPLLVETAGLGAASLALSLWCAAFRRRLRDVGALPG